MNKAEKYDSMIFNPTTDDLGIFMNYKLNISYVQKVIRESNPGSIFDLGCGTGNVTGSLSSDFKVIGNDSSKEMLELAKIKYPNMQFILSDLNDYIRYLRPCEADLMVISYVLHSFNDINQILKWLLNSIRSGSKIIILDYMFKSMEHKEQTLINYSSSGQDELVNFIKSKNFIIIESIEKWAFSNTDIQLNKINLCRDVWLIELHLVKN